MLTDWLNTQAVLWHSWEQGRDVDDDPVNRNDASSFTAFEDERAVYRVDDHTVTKTPTGELPIGRLVAHDEDRKPPLVIRLLDRHPRRRP